MKNLLPNQVYGDNNKFSSNVSSVDALGQIFESALSVTERASHKLKRIKDILTVTEYEKLDIDKLLTFDKEELNEYIKLLIKVRDSGAYDNEGTSVATVENTTNEPSSRIF